MKTTIVITMAGLGERFRLAGFTKPKFQIEVGDRTLFDWSIASLERFKNAGAKFVFVVRAADHASSFIAERCSALGIEDHHICELSAPTDGQATSALLATHSLTEHDGPMLVYNIDTHVNAQHLQPDNVRGDGWIPCFPGQGSKWSFARTDSEDRVVELREKERISEHATIGLYWFSSIRLYRDTYQNFFRDGDGNEKGERYIAPMYNHLIDQDLAVYIQRVPARAVIPLGTPEDLKHFEQRRSAGT